MGQETEVRNRIRIKRWWPMVLDKDGAQHSVYSGPILYH